jgi:hypothetical protein
VLPEQQAPEARFAKDRDQSPSARPQGEQPKPAQTAQRPPGEAVARGADGDLVIDIPHLSVDELSLDLAGKLILEHVKLEAKGLELGLFVKADVGDLAQAAQGDRRSRPPDIEGEESPHGLRRLLPSGAESAERRDGDDGTSEQGAAHKALHIAKEGGKVASLTAAGMAGGALLESTFHPSRKLPSLLQRRRSGPAGVLDRVREHLP